MKSWKLVFVVAFLGFFNGMISSENPLQIWRRAAVHLGQTAITMGSVSLSTGADLVTHLWEAALENYHYTVLGTAARIRPAIESRRVTLAHAQSKAADHNDGRFINTPSPIVLMSNSGRVRGASAEKPQRDSNPRYVSALVNDQIRQSTGLTQNLDHSPHFSGIQLFRNLLSINVKNASVRAVLKTIGKTCGIEILGQDVLPEKLISARLHNIEVEDAIDRIMRCSGTENYALSYVEDQEGRFSVSQIVIFPRGAETHDYHVTKGTELLELETVRGTIKSVRRRSRRMLVQQTNGPDLFISTRYDTKIARNADPAKFTALRVGDYVEIQRIPGSGAVVEIKAKSA
jgi:hypothetical protein